jgi:hypothetical protein
MARLVRQRSRWLPEVASIERTPRTPMSKRKSWSRTQIRGLSLDLRLLRTSLTPTKSTISSGFALHRPMVSSLIGNAWDEWSKPEGISVYNNRRKLYADPKFNCDFSNKEQEPLT